VTFSRDGKMLITAGSNNPIQIWDTATGKLLRSFGESRHNPAVFIAVSPDGKTLAARHLGGYIGSEVTRHSISLWEVATGKCLRVLRPSANIINGGGVIITLAFSQDGRSLLSLSVERQDIHHLRVWEVATGKLARHQPLLWKNAKERESKKLWDANPAVFSPDGSILATIHHTRLDMFNIVDAENTPTVYLWEVATGKELRRLTVGEWSVRSGGVAFSPDSRLLAISSAIQSIEDKKSSGAVHLWEVATGKEVRKWTADPTETYALAFSPDGKLLATGSGFGSIHLWETATGKELRQCQDYRAHVVALAFSPDGSMLASRAKLHDCTARLWEVASGKERVPLTVGHVGPVVSVSFSPDGKSLVSGGRDGLVGFWNAQTGQERRPLLRAGDFQALATPSPDGKTVLTVGNHFVLKSPSHPLHGYITTPTLVCVWDRATGQKLRQFEGPAGFPQSLALSADGKFLALTLWDKVCLLEVTTGKVMREFTDFGFGCAAFSPDGKTLAVRLGEDNRQFKSIVQFHAIATGKDLGSFKAHQVNHISCLAYSPDGQTLAVGGIVNSSVNFKPTIRLWRLQGDKRGWKEAGTLLGHEGKIWGLAFSPDGKTVASTSEDGTLRLWEVATGKERCCFVGHRGDVWCLSFSPDGRRLASGGGDATTFVWDVTGRLHNGQLRPAKLSTQEVQRLWTDLASADAAKAGQAVWTLAATPTQVLPLLRQYLRPIDPVLPGIDRLLADLDSDTFAVRQKAMDELAKLGEVAAPALRQAWAQSTLEKRRRLEQLLEPLGETFPLSGEKLRSHRALEVLGQMDTSEARQLLETLARGAPEARQTLEAQAALKCQAIRVNATKP
jgi:WD40 repeat protein